MFYEPSSGREYASLHAFRMAYPDTSFGALDTEAERNAAGIFTLGGDKPGINPHTHELLPGAIEARGGEWVRRWVAQPLPVEAMRANLMHAVSQQRWAVETGGLTLPGGATVGTAIDDQNRITSVIANAQLAGVASVDFKAQGGWVTLSLEQMRGIAAAIALHVQACFSAERAHHEAINSATEAELLAYDIAAGWPA